MLFRKRYISTKREFLFLIIFYSHFFQEAGKGVVVVKLDAEPAALGGGVGIYFSFSAQVVGQDPFQPFNIGPVRGRNGRLCGYSFKLLFQFGAPTSFGRRSVGPALPVAGD